MTTALRERLLGRAMINWETGCWEWAGHLNAKGYARIGVGRASKQVHRVSYELLVGPIPAGLQIDHLCRVRHCLNPAHLEAVTGRINTLRGNTPAAVNAAKTHCDYDHEFTPENTYLYRGMRHCRACKRTFGRESKRRTRAERRPS